MTPTRINAAFDRRAAVHAANMPWTPSPVQGVERKMLDRVGGEVARATSIVRYAPGSRFAPHVHGGGEEFLVLDGVFQDEAGDYPAGSYVRNPPTTRHEPGSAPGCVLFVKLWQFDPVDRTPVRLDALGDHRVPVERRPGVGARPLFSDRREQVRIEKWAAGARVAFAPVGGLELLCLDGGFSEGGEAFAPWSWLRLPVEALLDAIAGPRGCVVWLKEGHLRFVDTAPFETAPARPLSA
jgi:quercetin dioxygenase-like cupin family protein